MGCVWGKKRGADELAKIMPRLLKQGDEELYEWIKKERGTWHREDLALWNGLPTPERPGKWAHLEDKRVTYNGLVFDVFRSDTGKSPKWAFYYWNGNPIHLSDEKDEYEMVVDFFMRRIDLTRQFTPIFTFHHLFLDRPDATVHFQRYEPTQVGVVPRNLVCIYASKRLEEKEYPNFLRQEMRETETQYGLRQAYSVTLVSMRSAPTQNVHVEMLDHEAFIELCAGYLHVDRHHRDGHGISVYKYDAEDENGWLLEDITAIFYPEYVQKDALLTTQYTDNKENKEAIIKHYRSRQPNTMEVI